MGKVISSFLFISSYVEHNGKLGGLMAGYFRRSAQEADM